MSSLEDNLLDQLGDKAASLQNGHRGDPHVLCDVVALQAMLIINLYKKLEGLQTRMNARRKFWRNNCWNLISSTVTAAIAAVVVTWINGK